jgi:hypothetical protein
MIIEIIEDSLTHPVPGAKNFDISCVSVARLGNLIVSRSVATTCVRIDFYPSEVIVNRSGGV